MSEKEVELRDYQLELYHEIEKRQSSILFLPTGSGKTHIAFWTMKSMAAALKKPIEDGGKRTFFLVNTVQLVHQQSAVLSKLGNFEILPLTGDTGIDSFDKSHWYSIESAFEVFILTSQIYLDAIQHAFINLENTNLLILDECHHATGNHPMAQIMKLINGMEKEKRPKVLGLSATLFNSNLKKKNDFTEKLIELERLFDGEIITSKNYKAVKMRYATKPNESIEIMQRHYVSTSIIRSLNNLCLEGEKMLKCIKLKENIESIFSDNNIVQLFKPGLNRAKLLRTVMYDIKTHVEEYGLYAGYICCQQYIIQLFRYMMLSSEQVYVDVMLYIINLIFMIRKILHTSLKNYGENFESIEMIKLTSSEKIQYLFNYLSNADSSQKCIVFVQRKMTAKVLYKILKLFCEKHIINNNILNVDFIIGAETNPLRNTREGMFDRRKKDEIFQNFRRGLINILVATDVLEEGIDVQDCNSIIMFDDVKTFRSYVQSKGRARMKGGKYVILTYESNRYSNVISNFEETERKLAEITDRKNVLFDENDESSNTIIEKYTVPSTGAEVDNVSAIRLVYLYVSSLPRDLFTVLVPYWFYDKKTKECSVKLPLNSGITSVIKGPPQDNHKTAQQMAALYTVKKLHENGHLNDNLLPVKNHFDLYDRKYWLPNYEESMDLPEQNDQNNIFFTQLRVPVFLKHSRPVANTPCFLHIIKTRCEYEVPTVQRKLFCHELMKHQDYNFGILTKESWPPLCDFPVYADLGEIIVTLEVNASIMNFNTEQLDEISKFHRSLLLYVLKLVPNCFAYDSKMESNAYFIVPLKPNRKNGEIELSWRSIRSKFEDGQRRPTDEEIQKQNYTAENYIARVVTPWYNNSIDYIVYDISNEVRLNSAFSDSKFMTFADYFEKKYNLIARRPEQPLLLARPITKNLDGIRPRPITVSEKRAKKNRKDEITYLAPEFCHMQPFSSIYWYKSIIIPSVLHRVHYLLMAEELRQKIVNEAKIGSLKIPKNYENSVENFKNVDKKVTCEKTEKPLVKIVEKNKLLARGKVQAKKNQEDEAIKDIYRYKDVTIEDIKKYVTFIENSIISTTEENVVTDEGTAILNSVLQQKSRKYRIKFTESPKLLTLKEYWLEHGPSAFEILEALTLRNSQDVIHLERLETLGDSLLKYLVSLCIFIKCPKMNEGHLTMLKGKLVSNENLFYCGKKLDLGSYIKVLNFSARVFWSPPGFSIPFHLREKYSNLKPLSAFLAINIPDSEKFSGYISDKTIELTSSTDIANFYKNPIERKNDKSSEQIDFYFGQHKMMRKNVSDVVEALIGVYLKTMGIKGAFQVLKYIGILSHENLEELLNQVSTTILSTSINSIESVLPGYKDIEDLCNYKFNKKSYLLQAFCHPSFSNIAMVDCYQKLEFIGDAVLDFLITSYIFEFCGNLNPGQMTDLRSALVNNNTFGALAVRLGLHKYLLCHSRRLLDIIESFVTYQESKNFQIHGNELIILINEQDTIIAEEVVIPKALGDIFESLAGAIFLDSGCNLSIVWNIYYNIMKEEIDNFSRNIPINPVRALYEEASIKPQFSLINEKNRKKEENQELTNTKLKVSLKVFSKFNKKIYSYIGRGDTLKAAKRAVSKRALRDLNYDKFVI